MTAPVAADRTLRVLIVDDHADSAGALSELINEWGFKARVAPDGGAALRAFDEFRPRVVLLDLVLPDRNGYDVALELRERAQRRKLWLIVVTGFAPLTDSEAGKTAGVYRHLLKPVQPGTLRQILTGYQFAEEVAAGEHPPVPADG